MVTLAEQDGLEGGVGSEVRAALADRLEVAVEHRRPLAPAVAEQAVVDLFVFGLPVAGFAAPPGGPTLQAARAAMGNFQEIIRGRLIRPLVPGVGPALAEEIGHMADAHEGAAPPGAAAQPRIPVEGYQSLLLASGRHARVRMSGGLRILRLAERTGP